LVDVAGGHCRSHDATAISRGLLCSQSLNLNQAHPLNSVDKHAINLYIYTSAHLMTLSLSGIGSANKTKSTLIAVVDTGDFPLSDLRLPSNCSPHRNGGPFNPFR